MAEETLRQILLVIYNCGSKLRLKREKTLCTVRRSKHRTRTIHRDLFTQFQIYEAVFKRRVQVIKLAISIKHLKNTGCKTHFLEAGSSTFSFSLFFSYRENFFLHFSIVVIPPLRTDGFCFFKYLGGYQVHFRRHNHRLLYDGDEPQKQETRFSSRCVILDNRRI